jgi:hypothetical protein
MSKSSSLSSRFLWLVFGLTCLFLWPFNEQVECETRHGRRAIQFISYSKLQVWLPIPGIGGPNWVSKRYGVRFVDAWHSKWLMAGVMSKEQEVRHAACYSAIVNDESFLLYPVEPGWFTNLTFSNGAFGVEPAVPKALQRSWSEGLVSGGFPFYFFSAIKPLSQQMRLELSEPVRKGDPLPHLEWVTTSFDGTGTKRLIATQFGRLHSAGDGHLFLNQAYQMGGHPVSAPGFYSSPQRILEHPLAQVSLKRRLRSGDAGRSWELLDWEVLRPDLLPPGSKILLD